MIEGCPELRSQKDLSASHGITGTIPQQTTSLVFSINLVSTASTPQNKQGLFQLRLRRLRRTLKWTYNVDPTVLIIIQSSNNYIFGIRRNHLLSASIWHHGANPPCKLRLWFFPLTWFKLRLRPKTNKVLFHCDSP